MAPFTPESRRPLVDGHSPETVRTTSVSHLRSWATERPSSARAALTWIRFELSAQDRARLGPKAVVSVNGTPASVIGGRFIEVDLPDEVIRNAICERLRSELLIDIDGAPASGTLVNEP
jgi:hypothetical protein